MKPSRPPVTGMRLTHLPLMKTSIWSVLRLTLATTERPMVKSEVRDIWP